MVDKHPMSPPSFKYEHCDMPPGAQMRNFTVPPPTEKKLSAHRLAALVRALRRAL
jgi:hypothetical protein